MRVGLLGFGLIGGSIARALHVGAATDWQVAAWSPSGDGPRAAFDGGAIAVAAQDPAQAVDGADLVILAAPPLDCLDLLDELAGNLRSSLSPDAVVTDVVSTKSALVARAGKLGLRFVGGHPMAGRELGGFGAADAALFVDRPWVVCTDGGDEDAILRVEEIARAVGARSVRMVAAEHDAAVAAVSHLPLVVSAALVEAVFGAVGDADPAGTTARQIAASGWRDMSRLARGDVAMGAGIAATNAEPIAARIRTLRDVLDAWLEELERPGGPDVEAIEARLQEARRLALETAATER
jgi:prephenate dehydrogenase